MKLNRFLNPIALFTILILSSIFVRLVDFRLDLTSDKIYSLSPKAQATIQNLKGPVDATLYFSRSLKGLSPKTIRFGQYVQEMLKNLEKRSNGKLTVKVIDPSLSSFQAKWASRVGIQSTPSPLEQDFFFGVLFNSNNRESTIPFLTPKDENFVEEKIIDGILSVTEKWDSKVGVINPFAGQGWSFLKKLIKPYNLKPLSIDITSIPETIETLIVMFPERLTKKTLDGIHQFQVNGGNIIVFWDPFSRVAGALSKDFKQATSQVGYSSSLFLKWEISVSHGFVVGSMSKGTPITVNGLKIHYPYYLEIDSENLENNSSLREENINLDIDRLLFAEPGFVELKSLSHSSHVYSPLVVTGDDSGLVSTSNLSIRSSKDLADTYNASGGSKDIAVLLSPRGKGGKIVVIADVDFIHDSNAYKSQSVGGGRILRPMNDNVTFIKNILLHFQGKLELIGARGVGIRRPLTKLSNERTRFLEEKKEALKEISQEIIDIRKKVNELNSRGSSLELYSQELESLEVIQQKTLDRKKDISISHITRLNNFTRWVSALNILVIPFLISLIGLFYLGKRRGFL